MTTGIPDLMASAPGPVTLVEFARAGSGVFLRFECPAPGDVEFAPELVEACLAAATDALVAEIEAEL